MFTNFDTRLFILVTYTISIVVYTYIPTIIPLIAS